MVLPAPPAHALPVEPQWFDKLVVAIELSAGGVLTLVDSAATARLREAYLQLRASDPATDMIVDMRRLAELPPGATVILALLPPLPGDDLDWLNLNRPIVSDRRYNIVLWCEGDAAAVLARSAPDFFDWISARVDCPAAPAAHAVAGVKHAIRARACGIAWDGPGLVETLAAVRPGRPEACAYACFALRRGIEAARLEGLLAAASDPRASLRDLARQSGWTAVDVIAEHDPRRILVATRHALEREAARHERDDDPVVLALCRGPPGPELWADLGTVAANARDFEVAIRWLTAALGSLPEDASPLRIANLRTLRGQAHRSAGNITSARGDLALAYALARGASDASVIARSAASLANALLEQGEPLRAREYLESAVSASAELGDDAEAAVVLDMVGTALLAEGDPIGARRHLERALSIKRSVFATEDRPSIVVSLVALGRVLASQGDVEGARAYFERALEIDGRLWGQDQLNDVAALRAVADVHRATGNITSAGARLERAVMLQRVALGGDEHPDIADTLVALAGVIAAGGDLDRAQAVLERARTTQQKFFGSNPLSGVTTRRALANVLEARGDLAGARERLDRAAPSAGVVEPPPAVSLSAGAVAARYDLFLVSPSANKPSARALYDLLQPDVRVFLDECSLQPGDSWNQQIPAAQRASRATVVLISRNSDSAWYLRDEIVTAIALHRAAPAAHLLVPVLLEPGTPIPYGLSHVQAIDPMGDAAAEAGLAGVASRLREVVARLRGQPAPLPAVPAIAHGGGCDHVRLHDRLAKLTDPIFEQILLHARIDRGLIAPGTAPLYDRVLDVAQLAAVDPELCLRVTALLDQQAPWTR